MIRYNTVYSMHTCSRDHVHVHVCVHVRTHDVRGKWLVSSRRSSLARAHRSAEADPSHLVWLGLVGACSAHDASGVSPEPLADLPSTRALTALYETAGGVHWSRRDHWLSGDPCTGWFGVVWRSCGLDGRTIDQAILRRRVERRARPLPAPVDDGIVLLDVKPDAV